MVYCKNDDWSDSYFRKWFINEFGLTDIGEENIPEFHINDKNIDLITNIDLNDLDKCITYFAMKRTDRNSGDWHKPTLYMHLHGCCFKFNCPVDINNVVLVVDRRDHCVINWGDNYSAESQYLKWHMYYVSGFANLNFVGYKTTVRSSLVITNYDDIVKQLKGYNAEEKQTWTSNYSNWSIERFYDEVG